MTVDRDPTQQGDAHQWRLDMPLASVVVAGVPVDNVTMDQALCIIDAFVTEGRATGRTFQVATVNVDFVVNAHHEPAVLEILRRADLCIADGRPIVWYSQLAGIPIRERVTGADLIPLIADRAQRSAWRILLFGSAEGVAEQAAVVLSERFPQAVLRGLSGPMMADIAAMDPVWIDEIRSFEPDIVCVALGNPKQERWIDLYRSSVGSPVMIGVGGTLDFLVGGRRRAPQWMQRWGLEWVHRAAQEPRRLGRRYMHDARVFLPHLGSVAIRRLRYPRVRVRREPPIPWSDVGEDLRVMDLSGRDLGINADSTLAGLWRDAHRVGRRLRLHGISPTIVKNLARSGIADMFDEE